VTESLTAWPDTSGAEPPGDNPWRSAVWLLGRHPQLARIAARVPGVVSRDSDGDLDVDLEALAAALAALDASRAAWADYADRHPAPEEDREYDVWEAAGPQTPPTAQAIGVMSSGEVRMLRLLAVFSSATRVPLNVGDTQGLDDRRLIADWCRALLSA
jgi:hypothetical protein